MTLKNGNSSEGVFVNGKRHGINKVSVCLVSVFVCVCICASRNPFSMLKCLSDVLIFCRLPLLMEALGWAAGRTTIRLDLTCA